LSGNNGSAYDYVIGTSAIDLGPGGGGGLITGTISNLQIGSTNSYLEVGFVAKERSDGPISWGQPFYMFNNSAYMLVNKAANGDVIVNTGDTASIVSANSLNLGSVTGFDFQVQVIPNGSGAGGAIEVTINSQTISGSYGVDNWYGGTDEFLNGNWREGYGIAQGFAENLDTTAPGGLVSADVTMQVVPEPATMGLLALGGLAMIRRRRTA
jgi:hypothetical protein